MAAAIRELHRLLATAKAENVCDVCCGTDTPANCMCQGTGRMSDAARYLRKELLARERELDAAETSLAAANADLAAAWEEETKRLIALDRQYLAGLQQGYILGIAGEGEKYAEACAARAGQIHAARSPEPGKCECNIERNPSRMSAAALESGAPAEIVGPLCAYCKAAHQPRRDTTVKKGTPA